MTDVEHWIHQQVDFCSLMQELELLPLKIIWSDDVAINTAPTALLADLAALIAQVEKQFAKRSFDLNFGHGKTNIVVTFKGNQAPAFRKQYLHCDKPGLECALENGKRQCVPFVIMYKHLGVMFAPLSSPAYVNSHARCLQQTSAAQNSCATLPDIDCHPDVLRPWCMENTNIAADEIIEAIVFFISREDSPRQIGRFC